MAEDKVVLGDVSWQFGLSLFIIGRFFLLGMGLGLCIKRAGVAEFFDPTLSGSSDEEQDFDVLRLLSWLVKSYPPSVPEPFRLSKARSWCFGIRSVSSLNFGGSVLPTLNDVMVIQRWGLL